MPKKIEWDGKEGYFLEQSEIDRLSEVKKQLEEEVEKARGESKYKLQKLAKIIERKDKQIATLKSKLPPQKS